MEPAKESDNTFPDPDLEEIEKLRRMSVEEKLRQLEALFCPDETPEEQAEVERVRELWVRLKNKYAASRESTGQP